MCIKRNYFPPCSKLRGKLIFFYTKKFFSVVIPVIRCIFKRKNTLIKIFQPALKFLQCFSPSLSIGTVPASGLLSWPLGQMNGKFKQGSKDDYLKSELIQFHPQTSEDWKFGRYNHQKASLVLLWYILHKNQVLACVR